MGKGDRKTAKGKRYNASYGNARKNVAAKATGTAAGDGMVAARPGDESVAPAGPVSDGPLEALVKDMLRPMLKDWLDQRLPEMVEELVTREIARITGKTL